MKIAIVGSREFASVEMVSRYVQSLPPKTIIASGHARGVDIIAEDEAQRCGLEVVSIPAKWDELGRGAGYIRNIEIVEQVETVIAFWDGKSKGTLHTITEASKRGIRVIINPHIKGLQS